MFVSQARSKEVEDSKAEVARLEEEKQVMIRGDSLNSMGII
jgi:hypothetical protein